METSQYVYHVLHTPPDQKYLDLVGTYLLGERLADPFALDVTEEHIGDAYVEREGIRQALLQPGCTLILGHHGIGKTTLVRYLKTKLEEEKETSSALNILVPIPRIRAALSPDQFNAGKISILTAQKTAQLIFESFWKTFIVEGITSTYLDDLRKKYDWMLKLRDFYHAYASSACVTDDFELRAWIEAEETTSFPVQETPEGKLQRLVAFITHPKALEDVFGKLDPWPYTRVRLFIDGLERFSEKALQRLIQDAQQFYYSHWERLDLKLFINAHKERTIQQLSCVQDGRVPVYRLPSWTKSELRTLVENRMIPHLPEGEFAMEGPSLTDRINQSIVNFIKSRMITRLPEGKSAREETSSKHRIGRSIVKRMKEDFFFELLLEHAPEHRPSSFYTQDNNRLYPTPLQVLQLTRVLLAAIAGSFLNDTPNLSAKYLEDIVHNYWNLVEAHRLEEIDGE